MAVFSKKDDNEFRSPNVRAIAPKRVEASVKPVAYDDPSGVNSETPQVVHTEVTPTSYPTQNVSAESPEGFNTVQPQVAHTDFSNPDETSKEVVATKLPSSEIVTPNASYVPGSYKPEEEKQIEFNQTTIYDTTQKPVRAITPEYENDSDGKRVMYTLDKDGNIINTPNATIVKPTESLEVKDSTILPSPSVEIDSFLNPPKQETYSEPVIGSTPVIKAEVNSPALRDSLGNLGSYIWKTPSVDDILDNMGSKLGLGKLSDDYDGFVYGAKLVKQYHDQTGESYLKSALRALNNMTAPMAQSDATVPLLNSVLNSIPVISFFTKSKYSLANNKKTYEHEADYETKRTWLDKALGLASTGVCGLYYNATFYANHNIPKDKQDAIIQKLAGNPDMSAPDSRILKEELDMFAYARVNGEKTVINPNAQYTGIDSRGVGNKFSSFKNVFTQKEYKFDSKTKRISPDNYTVKSQSEILNVDSQKGRLSKGPYQNGEFGVAGRFLTGRPLKDSKINSGIVKYWQNFVTTSALVDNIATTSVSGFSYYNPPKGFDELSYITPIKTIGEYVDYQTKLYDQIQADSKITVGKNDIRYGMLPYNWAQVFQGFEISSNGNWNVSLCEFDDGTSMFVPPNRPTYGTWSYMPIMSYEYVDKELQTSSVEVSQSLNLMIPSANTYVSTLQITFLDDRFDRIYNWFSLYVNNIYGVYDGYAKPYKNCCIKITIDILDWDRTILKRLKLAAIPINFSQQYTGDSSDNYKTVSVTFSVVGEVYTEKTAKPDGRYRPIESEMLELEKIMASVDRSTKI